MNTTTNTIAAPRVTTPTPPEGITRALKGEWTKLRTLPSTWRTAVIALTLSIGIGAILCVSQAGQWHSMTAQDRAGFDPTACSLGGFFLVGAVLLGALAVRSITSEYSTGMIRATFAAMPNRRVVLLAKTAVVATFVLPVALLAELVSFQLGQLIFTSKHLGVSLGHPGVLVALVFGAVAVSLVAIMGVGLGGLIRHTTGATTALVLFIVGGAVLGQLLPAAFRQFLPGTALEATLTVNRTAGLLNPTAALAVLGAYAVVAISAASVRMVHRDA